MSDQCAYCTNSGDIAACFENHCYRHDDWIVRYLNGRIEQLQKELARLKEPIPIGLGQIAIATAFGEEEPGVERRIVFYDRNDAEVGTEYEDDRGKDLDGLPVRAQLVITNLQGARVLTGAISRATAAVAGAVLSQED